MNLPSYHRSTRYSVPATFERKPTQYELDRSARVTPPAVFATYSKHPPEEPRPLAPIELANLWRHPPRSSCRTDFYCCTMLDHSPDGWECSQYDAPLILLRQRPRRCVECQTKEGRL